MNNMTQTLRNHLDAYNEAIKQFTDADEAQVATTDWDRAPKNLDQLKSFIDETVFRRSEYLGGMAHVVLVTLGK